MHKLKNKHTGEVITTPYLAEVEEYLNSGDYEMKNEYPYIGKAPVSGYIVLFLAKDLAALIDGNHSQGVSNYVNYWVESRFTNITREYLANTYGKCESQEHADFICKLANINNLPFVNNYSDKAQWFNVSGGCVDFHSEHESSKNNEKLINLPLPPKKESKMPEEKPAYTKEMRERGELPPVGSYFVMSDIPNHAWFSKFNGLHCKVLALTEYENGVVVTFDSEKEGFGALWHYEGMEPLPTIENELSEIWDNEPDKHSIINAIIAKYNITPKE